MRQIRSLILVAVVISGCATAGKIGEVRLGMTKEQVIAVMGKPASVSAQGRSEYLKYLLSATDDDEFHGFTSPYFVRLVDGRVESFGRIGDFDSTKTPTMRVETDQTITQDVEIKESADLYTELSKLKALMDSGVLTEDEFQAKKRELLERY